MNRVDINSQQARAKEIINPLYQFQPIVFDSEGRPTEWLGQGTFVGLYNTDQSAYSASVSLTQGNFYTDGVVDISAEYSYAVLSEWIQGGTIYYDRQQNVLTQTPNSVAGITLPIGRYLDYGQMEIVRPVVAEADIVLLSDTIRVDKLSNADTQIELAVNAANDWIGVEQVKGQVELRGGEYNVVSSNASIAIADVTTWGGNPVVKPNKTQSVSISLSSSDSSVGIRQGKSAGEFDFRVIPSTIQSSDGSLNVTTDDIKRSDAKISIVSNNILVTPPVKNTNDGQWGLSLSIGSQDGSVIVGGGIGSVDLSVPSQAPSIQEWIHYGFCNGQELIRGSVTPVVNTASSLLAYGQGLFTEVTGYNGAEGFRNAFDIANSVWAIEGEMCFKIDEDGTTNVPMANQMLVFRQGGNQGNWSFAGQWTDDISYPFITNAIKQRTSAAYQVNPVSSDARFTDTNMAGNLPAGYQTSPYYNYSQSKTYLFKGMFKQVSSEGRDWLQLAQYYYSTFYLHHGWVKFSRLA
jgi:hypothetical protein